MFNLVLVEPEIPRNTGNIARTCSVTGANLHIIEQCKPIYEELPGWSEDITGVRSLDELPENARKYVERILELTGIQLMTFSVGPAREQTNIVNEIWS